MNRIWSSGLWAVPILAAVYFAADRGYIGWPIMLAFVTASMIVFAIRKRRGAVLRPMPPFVRKLPLWRFILIGAGLILTSFAWSVYCLIFLQPENQNTIIIPFTVLLIVGVAMAGGSLGLKLAQLIWDKL